MKQELEELLENDSFIRWINDRANKEEKDYWLKWMRQDPNRKELVEQTRELVTVAGLEKPIISKSEVELKRLEQSLDQLDAQYGIHLVKNMHQRTGTFFGAVAAGLLMLIAVLGFLLYENYDFLAEEVSEITKAKHEFRTDYGEKISLNLSDGSKIILNANSHLKYFNTFTQGQDIEVWLEGEAYFDIFHYEGNKQRSFTVHTPDGAVEVLGTQFSVKTTSEGTQAVLEKGKIRIKVDRNTSTDGEHTEVIMAPGELVHFSSGIGKVELAEVNPRVYTSWIENTWVFDKTPLIQVKTRIEETFGVEVEIAPQVQQKILSGSIKSTNLEFIQEALSRVINEPVTKRDNTLMIGKMD